MIVTSISEDKTLEKRVAITPEIAKKYISSGFDVTLSKDYGEHLGFKNQHYESFCEWYGDNENIVLLTSKLPVREKREIYQKISDGIVKIIIGRHAVFQDELI